MRRLAPALGLAVCLAACTDDSSPVCEDSVVTQVDSMTDFAAIQSFAVLPAADYPDELPGDLPDDVQTDLDAANAATRRELLALGLMEVDPATEEPDVYAFSVAATESDSGVVWQCVPGFVWWGLWGWVWDPCAWMEGIPVNFTVGTVLVGIADPVEQKAVFGGAVQGVLECGDASGRLDRGVSNIFANYPTAG